MADMRANSIRIITESQSPQGAYVACPNFSQYRYCWLRDGSFIAYAMDRVGSHDSARLFHRWVDSVLLRKGGQVEKIADALAGGSPPNSWDMLPTRYRLDGLDENDDWPNFQLDGYGTWLWGLSEHLDRTGDMSLLADLQESIGIVLRYLALCWRMPSYDCWEEFGDRLHPSTLACLYGGLTAINRYLGRKDLAQLAGTIHDYILTCGVVSGRFAKSIGNPSVDANLLWLSIPFGVVATTDPLMLSTVNEIEKRLLHQGVHRYPEDTYYGGGEWLLLACWLGWYYCRVNRAEAALPIKKWVESCATDQGELPEQINTHLNHPEYLSEWEKRWGAVATPLLWSHAMYLVLLEELSEVIQVAIQPAALSISLSGPIPLAHLASPW